MISRVDHFFAPENLDRKLKLDLHCHCSECLGVMQATPEGARLIIDRVKEAGLDGIAITEHWDRKFGLGIVEIARAQFSDEGVLLLPGREYANGLREEIVEFFLPGNRVFRIWVHPRHLDERSANEVGDVQAIEVDSDLHGYELDKEAIRRYAQAKGLFMFTDSDAHKLYKIGSQYNLISMREIMDRALEIRQP